MYESEDQNYFVNALEKDTMNGGSQLAQARKYSFYPISLCHRLLSLESNKTTETTACEIHKKT